MTSFEAKPPSSTDSSCPNCSAFLNWDEEELGSEHEKAVVFRPLIATVKLQPALDCIVVLISSASKRIITATMKMLNRLLQYCSAHVRLALVKAGLIPQIINTLNPQSLSFAETVDIQIYVANIIWYSLWLATPNGLEELEIEDDDEQQALHKTLPIQVFSDTPRPTPPNISFLSTNPGFRPLSATGMEQNRRNCATDGEDIASYDGNGGHRRCDGEKAAKRPELL
ncbi:hypothetical protein BLNAU_14947 [Blattamonas nauphoetae]|uniref:Uncharacterized protein n=1 Tax=Blattamonas nauphoetae TaxID=2049346 RepID=A0ABQ9XG02_9EUKA|nr:hypothetical protein BLNAU_14947 [Blattamonas nauphoetae]